MAKKAVLGRGLDALLSTSKDNLDTSSRSDSHRQLYNFEERVVKQGQVSSIPVEKISANPYQPRTSFNEDALEQLASSIKQLGIIQPITVRLQGEGYELISGERRLRAAKRAGLAEVPAYVREADIEAMLEMAIVENIQRENLDPIEVALGYQRLIDECNLTQEQVAEKVGKSRSTVTNLIRLLKLAPSVQSMLRDGAISIGHARALLGVEVDEDQVKLATRIKSEDLSVRAIEAIVRTLSRPVSRQSEKIPQVISVTPTRDNLQVNSYIDAMRGRLGTHVQIKRDPEKGGRIEIAFYSDDDLDRIAELLLD